MFNSQILTMKAYAVLTLASIALAAPAADTVEKRQLMTMTANELTKGACKDVTFIWVRGTTELGNLGEFVGGRLYPELKKVFPSLAVEGVTYGAGVPGNLMPGGGDPAGIKEATKDYNLAATKCPNTIICGGGYSQGAAITHRTVENLPDKVKERIAGITLYGDTQYYQDKGQIKRFPKEKVHTYCNGFAELKTYSKDGVCNGLLNVNYGHMSYGDSMKPGAKWLKEKVDEFKAAKGGKGGKEETSQKLITSLDAAVDAAAEAAISAPIAAPVDPVQVEQLSRTLGQAKSEAAPLTAPSVQ